MQHRFLRYFTGLSACALGAVLLTGCAATPPGGSANNATGNAATDGKSSNETRNYTNSPQGLAGKLKENYVDFSFDFPAEWTVKEDGRSANAQNFIKVERSVESETEGEFTLENFAVGYFSTTGDEAKDAKLYPQLVKQLNSQFAKGFPGYKKTSEGKTKVGDMDGYQFRFESHIAKTPRGPVTLWGRAVLLPNSDPKVRNGVALIMIASSLAPELKTAQDLGRKGELPVILKSFRFEPAKEPDAKE